MEVDVLIVGAGPAGSTTARYCASKDLDVLMIDRREEIGYPVQCGEFLPATSEMYSMFPRTMDLDELFQSEESLRVRDIEAVDMIAPSGRSYRCAFRGYTLDRRRFDKYLVKLALEAGARLEKGVSLLEIKDGVGKTSMGDIHAKVIVGADGPNSRTARQVGLKNPEKRYPAITCQARGEFNSSIKMYFGSVAPGGYAWVIPKDKGANIGLGILPSIAKERPSVYFSRFVSSLGIEYSDVVMGLVPMSGPVKNIVNGNAMLVGDAAGQVMASNGGGIPLAMIAGRIAGRAVRSHIKHGAPLVKYQEECARVLGRPLANSLWTRKLGDLFFPSDSRTGFAMRVLGAGGLTRAIRCRRVFYVI